jgi:DHA1 family bicyclomycin/chloramphenicol resistance-like MFS transporter
MTKITDGAGLQAASPGMGLPAPARPPMAALLLLMALTALGQMATNLVVPSLATIAADLALDPGSTGLILSAVLVGIGLGQLVVGPMSDRYGRRPVLLAGLAVYVLGGIAATLAPSGAMLLAARLMQGLGASAGLALPRAIARDRYAGATFLRVMSALTLAMAVMPGLAPVLGGMIAGQYGWRASLAVSAASGILVAAVVVLFLPESHHSRSREGGVGAVLGNYRHVLRRRVFLGYALATGAVIGGAYAEVAASQRLFGATFGWAPTQVGLASSSYAMSFLLGGLLAPRLRIGHHANIRIGIGMVVLSPLIFLALDAGGLLSAGSAMAVIMLSQVGVGFMMPPCIALGLMAVEGAAGTSSAVMGAIHMVTGALGAALVGAIAMPVVWGLPAIMLGFALLAVGFAALARPPR